MRRIGVLMSTAADDSLGQSWSAAFAQGLQQLRWEVGADLRIEYRWGAGDTERFRRYAVDRRIECWALPTLSSNNDWQRCDQTDDCFMVFRRPLDRSCDRAA